MTIVTPSYNQAPFLEETIRSVLLQGYPALEYIVIDGGSTDGSQDIIRKYAQWITYWVSKPDGGQAAAIDRGLQIAKGELFNFINSDDLLAPGALQTVATAIQGYDAVAGACQNFSADGDLELVTNRNLTAIGMVRGDDGVVFHQPAVWLRRTMILECGGLQTDLNYSFDWDLCIRYLALFPNILHLPTTLARFRLHNASKTVRVPERLTAEREQAITRLLGMRRFRTLHRACDRRRRRWTWWQELEQINHRTHLTGLRKAGALIWAASKDPSVRWSRLTFGAVRRAWVRG